MKEFMLAILEDNPSNERTNGLSDSDIMEVYGSSVEILSFEESVSVQSLIKSRFLKLYKKDSS